MSTTHTYTRDGIEVARYADGLVKWGPADRLLDNCIPPAYAAAIHAAFLAELGLWLDEETGCLVDTASRSFLPDDTIAYSVLPTTPTPSPVAAASTRTRWHGLPSITSAGMPPAHFAARYSCAARTARLVSTPGDTAPASTRATRSSVSSSST